MRSKLGLTIFLVLGALSASCAITATAREGSRPGPQSALIFGRLSASGFQENWMTWLRSRVEVQKYSGSGGADGPTYGTQFDSSSGYFAMELPAGRYAITTYMLPRWDIAHTDVRPGLLVFDAVANEADYVGDILQRRDDRAHFSILVQYDFARAAEAFRAQFPRAGDLVNRPIVPNNIGSPPAAPPVVQTQVPEPGPPLGVPGGCPSPICVEHSRNEQGL